VVTLTATTTYNLSCTGAGGTIAKQLTIGVTPPPATTNPNQFTEGMVTLSFDDAWASQYTNALPILQASGLPATFYLISSVIQNNANFPGYMTPAMATTIANAGHEIADHTITHSDLTTLSSAQVTNEITASRTYLQNLTGKTITSLAYPYGSVNTTVKNLTKQAGYVSARGVDDSQLNTPSSDKYNLFGQCVDSTVTLATIKASIDQAKANKQWYILCLHEIATTGDQYTISPSQLQQIITYIKQVGIKTVTVQQGRALML
jgi:peptidoglycan/xylan/chitin deacetylase (PgdA/CDA1 family)